SKAARSCASATNLSAASVSATRLSICYPAYINDAFLDVGTEAEVLDNAYETLASGTTRGSYMDVFMRFHKRYSIHRPVFLMEKLANKLASLFHDTDPKPI